MRWVKFLLLCLRVLGTERDHLPGRTPDDRPTVRRGVVRGDSSLFYVPHSRRLP